ncbi:PBECR4 domain-containing protein [Streptococcus sp. DTU_2020_1000888_1_SI_GRL_NUU_041A]|uniref:PBECR4 domain-containing protein n=1 Tax=Streptococcus sp. DTU_2020_1000888_1_SI_GRL_NUU_041A TaxID=3077723 RepID=UPI0028E61F2D|nr:PBECR4 domain-containing protein [Streptococcus sp. DTU_2020_1000888_1_SI_GRL_NUU_041A]WNU95503.1 PBECR4 domain-containing protein [Streptococcus sp. DTU_2020_1000888_1_SI_GRL_NUU_041A]
MPEETHQPQGNRGRSRRERVEIARSRDILDVANELNMELVRDGKDYRWKEHDSLVISPDKNKWNWFSRHQGGDVIALVETIREINFNQAIDYLNDGTFKEFTAVEREKEPFRYHLQPYEQDFVEARNYLKVNRGLSDETIDFFLEKGVLAQANAMLNNSVEPVVVFKTLTSSGEITGATLQGIEENRDKWPGRGFAKNIIRNSDGMDGLHVDIGKPNRLIFTESSIDLMSYYEINKDTLQDVRLVSMDGLKEATIGRHLAQLQSELSGRPLNWTPEQLAKGLQTAIESQYFADGKHSDMITLAVDNDTAGRTFIEELKAKGAAVTVDLPELRSGQDKADWNDALKNQNEKTAENSRLTEGVNQSFDKENFIKGLELMQKYSVEEVLSRPPIYQGDDQRLEALQIDLEGFDYKPLDDFIRQYIDPNYDLDYEEFAIFSDYEEFAVFSDAWNNFFRNGAGKDLTVDSFITLAKNNGLVDEVPVVEPWQALTVLEPIKTYSVKNGDLQEDFDSVSGLLDFVKQKLSETERKILEQELAEVGRGTPTDILMTIDSALVGDFDVYVNGQSIISVYPNNIDEQATVLYVRSSEEAVKDVKKAPEQSQERLIDRTSGGTGSLQLNAEGSPTPVPETSTFEQTVTSHPTSSYPYLHFSTNYDKVQRRVGNYHPITPADLRRINQYAPSIQSTASWYLNELAGSRISFVYADHGEENVLQVSFQKENFIHLSGIRPFEEGKRAADFLEDFAAGQGHYDSMLISNAIKDKLQVLPMLQDILEPQSFVLDDLSSVEKLHNLNMREAIKAKDEDFLLLFKGAEGEKIPASLMKLKGELAANVKSLDEKVILGVYRERDNQIEQLSINEEFIADGGKEMLDNLKNQLSSLNEPSQEQTPTLSPVEKTIDAAIFTQVLDDVRNIGNFIELGVTVPEEAKEAWAKYIELSDMSSGDFNTIVLKAEELGFLDKNSSFYQEWRLEHIYNNNYHVRFQWLEEQVNNLNLPFEEHSLVSYQDFSRELYKANQENTNNNETNIPKIKFDIYAPGGEVIKEGVRYNIGDETKPISQMLGLGYRRLKGQPILANIDENVLSQLENRALNQEISQEADNPQNSLTAPETDLTASLSEEREFRSPKQETKGQLDQRVNEILADNQKEAEEVALAKESPGEIDYSQVTPHELSEIAFQKIREFTRSPEALAEYMDFMSKFPQLSPRNVALIQDQWQGANAVATYNQWQALGKTLGIRPEDVIETRNTYTNKRTGETKEVVHQGLSVKSGEKAQITLFRPLMARMIPVLDDQGNQVKNSKGNPKFKKISEATPQEKALLKERKLRVVQFQERDQETGLPKFTTYKVFELSQTTLKPESYPKAMPNRQYQFDTDQVKTKEVLDGLCDYAGTLGVHLLRDEVHELGNAKGAFYPGQQKILLNPNNLPGEQIATTIHELAHATLHNPKFTAYYKEDVSTPRKELEAEMTSHLVSKHFGLDTSEAAIDYMAGWTKNLTQLDDKQLAESMKRIHQTVSKMVKHIEHHTKPYEPPKNRGQSPNFPKSPTKGLKP